MLHPRRRIHRMAPTMVLPNLLLLWVSRCGGTSALRGNATTIVRATQDATSTSCGVPQFLGDWEALERYPLNVGEAQGAIIDHDLVVFGGFLPGFQSVAVETYALRVGDDSRTSTTAEWRRMEDCPLALTHAAYAVHGTRMFVCGGYVGGHPGPATAACFVYEHPPSNDTAPQWTRLPDLPEPRAGAGMVYDPRYQALVFSGGAVRPYPGQRHAVDHDTTWMLAPDAVEYGWQEQAQIPHFGNHLSFATGTDGAGGVHHYFMGGQVGEDERNGNKDELLEYRPLSDEWIPLAPLPIGRGHASSSTVPFGCGFLIAGGAINGGYQKLKTNDVSYYSIEQDAWTSVGNLTEPLKTPVCDVYLDYLYCSTGYTRNTHRRRLSLAAQVSV